MHLTIFVKCYHTLFNLSLLEIAKWRLNPSFPLPHYMVVGDGFHVVVLDMAGLATQQAILMVIRASTFLVHQIVALMVFIWTIMALVLFILLSPILQVIALTILNTVLQVAGMLETRTEVNEPDVVHITPTKEEEEALITIKMAC